jgi:hypothetical protein
MTEARTPLAGPSAHATGPAISPGFCIAKNIWLDSIPARKTRRCLPFSQIFYENLPEAGIEPTNLRITNALLYQLSYSGMKTLKGISGAIFLSTDLLH